LADTQFLATIAAHAEWGLPLWSWRRAGRSE